ncbi:MAG: hypothetical protein IMX00_03910 [Limnochordales bacterium]|nr:hypothetical protein [Limnochordales bacterium]
MKVRASRVAGSLLVLLVVAMFWMAVPALAATEGTATLQLSMSKFAALSVVTSKVTLTPTDNDMTKGYVESEKAVEVQVRTNSNSGATLKVYGTAGNPGIALTDLLIRSDATGSQVKEWTAIAGNRDDAQTIWSISGKQSSWLSVYLDLRIENLWNYAEGTYSNTLTFVISTN